MGQRQGSGYIGSGSILTSTANQEIIPAPPVSWNTKYNLYKFSFDNDLACSVNVNGGNPIYLKEGQGFEISSEDAPIYSFIIVESGIQFNWIGCY